MQAGRIVRRALWALPAAGYAVGYLYRPRDPQDPEDGAEFAGVAPDMTLPPDTPGGRAAVDLAGGETQWAAFRGLRATAEVFQLGFIATVADAWMRFLGTTEFVDDDEAELRKWIVDAEGRRYGRPLLTAFNHHSCVDEPLLMGRVVPFHTLWWPFGANVGPVYGAEARPALGLLDNGVSKEELALKAERWLAYTSPEAEDAWLAAKADTDKARPGTEAAFRAAMREMLHSRGPASLAQTTSWRAGRGRMRYTICTREVCFGMPALSAFFNTGGGFPVLRLFTPDQPASAWMLAHTDAGHWTNIFPEARTWQEGGIPRRDAEGRWSSPSGRLTPPYSGVGPFKRGIGKIVANARLVPIVVPVFHQGMAHVLPQSPTNEVESWIPQTGHNVTVAVGEGIDCTDLIVEYHRQAHERALKRERRRREAEAAGIARPPPLQGHRRAMKLAAREFGAIPPAFCGVPIPPKEDPSTFAKSIFRGTGESIRRVASDAFHAANAEREAAAVAAGKKSEAAAAPAPAALDGDAAAVDSIFAEWKGTPQEVREWERSWTGHIWVPTRPTRNRPSAEAVEGLVPAYLEGPVRARPRDYLWLTEEEAIAEHKVTLELYNKITQRVEDGMRAAEKRALAWRHERGLGPTREERS
ncbi:hypothetical protein FNF31_00517 [Cafeteria roenbergensis]|uniref:Uncharacterized protein n=1 Tax=Cafeteria roenbergensis TaxID=33653 RepID=A0A5A8DRV1_CAFRO|nr:hypothetical protein FNF28_06366 [Cafeteria roenbergensis]KAA0168018.1 hypothetical protein FNF31_00517 [Cafeteria roenbergensis]